MFKKVVFHSLIYGLGPFVPKIISLLMLPIFTKFLTTEDYGIQSVMNSSLGLISVLSMLGLQLPMSNVFFQHSNHFKKRWGQFYGFLNIWMIFYSFLLAFIIYLVIPKEVGENLYWIIILNIIPIVCFGPADVIGQLYYQLNQKPKQVVIRTIVISFITIALNFYTIVVLDLHYMGWFIANCISMLLLHFSYWYPLHYILKIKPIYKFKRVVLRKGLSVSLPMLPHYYGSFLLSSSDVLLLKFFLISTSQIGYYGFATSFGGLMAMAVGAINTAAAPVISEQIKLKNYDSVRSLTWGLQFLLIVLSSVGCFWLKDVFEIMVNNDELKTTYFLAAIFIMSHNYRPMYFGVATVLFYRERTRNLWKVTFGAGIICVLLNVLFIPIYGIKCPAYILFFSYLIMGYGTFFLKDYKEVAVAEFKPLLWLSLTIFSFAIVLIVVDLTFVYKILISLLYILTIPVYFYQNLKSQKT
ncbi:oligosaccharide flippase family protein [Flavobacterium sp. Fl-318]|uniref:Oligosaccharide flippase family protein n=1 Tax=Flavobacterium cupriresistens TaxID=2893885 RepID=A0ABU4RF83_9FLAO|nr:MULTISPECIES: oligosaccharide flippase family protein [unclassified Flavobacterium]MDX6190120.1 oligosaccharide flippase family protein [Flavobacterium sp. Fl-318]UFH42941.1 oligosaccharide flippase family protein [Flavobacterium sp. F-323]